MIDDGWSNRALLLSTHCKRRQLPGCNDELFWALVTWPRNDLQWNINCFVLDRRMRQMNYTVMSQKDISWQCSINGGNSSPSFEVRSIKEGCSDDIVPRSIVKCDFVTLALSSLFTSHSYFVPLTLNDGISFKDHNWKYPIFAEPV